MTTDPVTDFYRGPVDCIVAAAGTGSRMKSVLPKQYMTLKGRCVIEHTLERLLQCPYVGNIIVVLSASDTRFKSLTVSENPKIITVTGGAERCDSVLSGLKAAESSWCMVHDAARPFVDPADIQALLENTAREISADKSGRIKGGLLAQKSADTLKCAGADDLYLSKSSVDRTLIWRAQTPQLFERDFLIRELERQGGSGKITDEASVLDALGYAAVFTEGSSLNFKLTTPEDFVLAEALADKLFV